MKSILRNTVVAAGLAATTLIGMTPANAAVAVQFTGVATIDEFGVGASNGTALLCVNGTVNGGTATCTTGYNGSATFSLNEDPSSCPATGDATGTVTVNTNNGVKTGGFTWVRVGATAAITGTTGALAGARGTAAFAVPDVFVCGQSNVVAHFAGSLAGAP